MRKDQSTDVVADLTFDLVEWIAKQPRRYCDVMDVWRTSCPRLSVWEEAVERGLICRKSISGQEPLVVLTAQGEQYLHKGVGGG